MSEESVKQLYIGVDPGPVNTGWCIRGPSGELVRGTFNPSATGDVVMAADRLFKEFQYQAQAFGKYSFERAAIERYVTYKGVFTSNAEETCLFIGSLTFLLRSNGIKTSLVRAITWKPKVCKLLVTEKGFDNPSKKLDKKFSMAAASRVLDITTFKDRPFKTDHEADAICLSYFAEKLLDDGT